ncbi:hypothetical protein ACFY0B_39000 [Streptomyces sp. NPDC001797]|uniref:hypothetical protein n=1 Tax=Streptomyces sp. NPDC001797 TaxID=3364610 RepID=UPI0036B5EAD3
MIGSAQISVWWFTTALARSESRARGASTRWAASSRTAGGRGPGTAGPAAERSVLDPRHAVRLPAGADPVTVAAAMNPNSHG